VGKAQYDVTLHALLGKILSQAAEPGALTLIVLWGWSRARSYSPRWGPGLASR